MLKIGSLCTGYGGLDMAVEAYFGAETVWTSDVDKYASLAIKERLEKPNIGDLTQVDWSKLERIDILTAGYPCQPFSQAGQRKGTNDKRHIWPHIAKAISIFRPRIIILENVRGHLSLGFKEVLKDLAQLGYDAKWSIVRASDVGAPHQRARLFIVAYPNRYAREESRRTGGNIHESSIEIINGSNREINGCGSEDACNPDHKQLSPDGKMSKLGRRFDTRFEMSMRSIPDPLENGKLNTKFVEYMMGLPEGWVTDLPISRAQQFKLLGNGVVPQQAYRALQLLCDERHIDCDTPKGHA
jgi:DNA (cytosine-5)-methyltransferase 1